jgi:DNA processing protein
MTEAEAYVAFNLTEQVGSVKVERLVAEHGSVAAAWESYDRKCSRAGGEVDWRGEFAKAKRYGVRILTPADGDYPEIFHDAPGRPLALYVKGDASLLSSPCVAMVGTRRSTAYGLEQAFRISRDLAARGWTILSGLAIGIDAQSHRGALDAGGKTVGIIGSGLDRFYPEENRELAREIVAKGGAVASEFPFGRPPDQQTFPQRNHVVAALARGVVAVEAPHKSGTLITTSLALDMGRVVMAIPGRVDSRASGGCNELIRAGARLVRNAADVEEALSELIPKTGTGGRGRSPSAPPPPFSIEESMIMREVDAEGVSMDVLIRRTGLPAEKVNALCMALRLKGRVRFFPGNRVALPKER